MTIRRWLITAAVAAATAGGGTAAVALAPHDTVGPRADGTAVLPNGWRLTPAGGQSPLGEMPLGSAVSPDGQTMLVSNDGQYLQSLQLVDVATGKVRQTIEYRAPEGLFLGVAWSPDGRHAYASAGSNDKVRVYDFDGGRLTERAPIVFPKADGPLGDPIPAGLAVSPDGSTLYVADQNASAMSVVDVATGRVTASVPAGPAPYSVQLSNDGATAFVSDWGADTVSVIDTASRTLHATVKVGVHPSAMALAPSGRELYVANSDSDSVSVLDVTGARVLRTIDLAPFPHAPAGAAPNALAVAADGRTLYVANAGDNDVAVVDLADGDGHDAVAGLIPTAWYPTGVHLVAGGTRLAVTNARGLGAGPNPAQPGPYDERWGDPTWQASYIYSMIKGQLSLVDVPDEKDLARYTRQVGRNNAPYAPAGDDEAPGGSAIPLRGGQASPIKHVIYVIKENRTYDQVLGDLGRGNGDQRLALFGRGVTPNQHRLAEQFVTLDNFYTNGEVSGQGWQWVSGGASNTHVEKTMPGAYGGRYSHAGPDAIHVDDAGRTPERSYLWDAAIDAGIGLRVYGWWADGAAGSAHAYANAPELDPYLDRGYPGWSLADTDRSRIREWAREFDRYVATDSLPGLQILQLPDDHTAGTVAGGLTPKAMVADNDAALGQLVDKVSHSRYWKDTAIFVVEDDAQNGPDHVDAHRTIAQVISPYTQIARVDSTLYSQVSMLGTIERILGLRPLSRFDAAAPPMLRSFQQHPDLTPYDALVPRQDMDERNPATAPMARQAAKWDFAAPDAAPSGALNEAIWKSIRGRHSRVPAPHGRGARVAVSPDGGHRNHR